MKKMGRYFFAISVILSVLLLVWACGDSNVKTEGVSLPDAARQAGVQSESNLAESDPSNECWGKEIQRDFQKAKYAEIRGSMHPGDVIAFSGGTFASRLVMAVTGSNVSHVGLVVPATFLGEPSEGPVVAEVTE